MSPEDFAALAHGDELLYFCPGCNEVCRQRHAIRVTVSERLPHEKSQGIFPVILPSGLRHMLAALPQNFERFENEEQSALTEEEARILHAFRDLPTERQTKILRLYHTANAWKTAHNTKRSP